MVRRARLVTLTTDIGSAYAAQMKGVLYRSVPPGHVVDIAHDLSAHAITEAAFLLRHIAPVFPPGTVHVAVVDPGVGGPRAPIAIACRDGSLLVGPDNGVLAPLADALGGMAAVRLDPARVAPSRDVSATFEGRDLFAPAAGRLATGARLGDLGLPHPWVHLALPSPHREGRWAVGEVQHVDRFGNAITNLPTQWFGRPAGSRTIRLGARRRRLALRRTYSDLEAGDLGLVGSSFGTLEVCAREGRAVDRLPLGVGRGIAVELSGQR